MIERNSRLYAVNQTVATLELALLKTQKIAKCSVGEEEEKTEGKRGEEEKRRGKERRGGDE